VQNKAKKKKIRKIPRKKEKVKKKGICWGCEFVPPKE